MAQKYSQDPHGLASLGFLMNAMESRGRSSGDGDRNCSFPRSDAEDLSRGCRFIPGEVTMERRAGRRVVFHDDCRNPCCWYWELKDGSRIYHWSPGEATEPCSWRGNPNVNGGTVKIGNG